MGVRTLYVGVQFDNKTPQQTHVHPCIQPWQGGCNPSINLFTSAGLYLIPLQRSDLRCSSRYVKTLFWW